MVFSFMKDLGGEGASGHRFRARFCNDTRQFSNGGWLQHCYQQNYFSGLSFNRFRLFFRAEDKRLVKQVETAPVRPLSTFIKLSSGLIGKLGKKSIVNSVPLSQKWRPGLLSGSEVRRYSVSRAGAYILYDTMKLKSGFKDAVYDEPKLLCRQTGDHLVWAYDEEDLLCLNNLHVGNRIDSRHELLYVLGVVNSSLINTYYQLTTLETGRALAQTDIETLSALPIRAIDFSDSTEQTCHDRMVQLVESMQSLHNDLQRAKIDHERELIQRQINATDKQIDQLVYRLYDLTDEQIQIVEEA